MENLRRILGRIDGRGYRAYREIGGRYALGDATLHVDHVQSDPFAPPSRVRVRVPMTRALLPEALLARRVRRIALEDRLARAVRRAIARTSGGRRGTGKSGLVAVDAGAQEVLERTAVRVTPEWVEARLGVGLPASGRRVLARQAEAMLCREIPEIAGRALFWNALRETDVEHFVAVVENQETIRAGLEAAGLIAFVGDGAILPRESGASDRPLREGTIVFEAPEALRVEFPLRNPIDTPEGRRDRVAGLGIPRGVTLIVGGGYHGKSTLLRAIERGIYPHIPGDGREMVVTDPGAVKIRAEDGRRVEKVDIAAFIADLPFGRGTRAFSSEDASGSTSEAANILEAVEAGASALLLDEDTSATNFMVRDARMQRLVTRENEPITPFVDRVREMYDVLGVSTVLVMGGCGDYFDVADHVLMMKENRPFVVTEAARRIARSPAPGRRREVGTPMSAPGGRIPEARAFDPSRGRRAVKIDAKARDMILFGRDPIDLRGVEQIVDRSQTRAIGLSIHRAAVCWMDGHATLRELLDRLDAFFDDGGLDDLDPRRRGETHPGDLARPRRYEVAAAINRLRTLRMRRDGS